MFWKPYVTYLPGEMFYYVVDLYEYGIRYSYTKNLKRNDREYSLLALHDDSNMATPIADMTYDQFVSFLGALRLIDHRLFRHSENQPIAPPLPSKKNIFQKLVDKIKAIK